MSFRHGEVILPSPNLETDPQKPIQISINSTLFIAHHRKMTAANVTYSLSSFKNLFCSYF